MARLANASRAKPARLTVVPMEGWKRAMRWRDTGREVGRALAEPAERGGGSRISRAPACSSRHDATEGRGTDDAVPAGRRALGGREPRSRPCDRAGFALDADAFTPRASEAAPSPKHRDVECAGVRVAVTDASATRPYELGLRLLQALRKQAGFGWTREGALDWLVGHAPRARGDRARRPASRPCSTANAADLAAWERERAPRAPLLTGRRRPRRR